jgi:hypothetical protein
VPWVESRAKSRRRKKFKSKKKLSKKIEQKIFQNIPCFHVLDFLTVRVIQPTALFLCNWQVENDSKNYSNYGTTNRAFDPNPEDEESGLHGVVVPRLSTTASDNSTEDDEDEKTPRASQDSSEYVTHEGRSTFYGGQNPSHDDDYNDDDAVSVETNIMEDTVLEKKWILYQ